MENRVSDDCSRAELIADNVKNLRLAKRYGLRYQLIDDRYEIEMDKL